MSDVERARQEPGAVCAPEPRYAALYVPPRAGDAGASVEALVRVAQAFSPRYECRRDGFVVIDVTGFERLFGAPAGRGQGGEEAAARHSVWQTIGDEIERAARTCGLRGHVAMAGSQVAAMVLARARPGVTVVPAGGDASALAEVPIDILIPLAGSVWPGGKTATPAGPRAEAGVATFAHWGVRTLGELAALPPADLSARLGRQAGVWQGLARGEDVRPFVPTEPDERFDGALDLEWPIEGLEPLSFVLTRILEPLSTRLERRDRGAAVLHVMLDLVTRDVHARHLQLPAPIRDVRTLRTLALLDIEAHPPAGAIDRVEVVIDPTPGRILQHTLFTRALPTPERLSTLIARLSALMGQDRIGAPADVDTYRPGAFVMQAFAIDHEARRPTSGPDRGPDAAPHASRQPERRHPEVERPPNAPAPWNPEGPLSALRRCRQPVPARVALEAGRPVRVTTDRRGFCGGAVVSASGPWRTSGWWWADAGPRAGARAPSSLSAWNHDEWDVALSDGAVYRVFHDRDTGGWFIDGVFD
jgi:protein ImuB